MSIHLMSLVWEIDFPTQTQKMTALKLADYASEDGSGIYPSNRVLARQVACDKRSIQHVLKCFRSIELLYLVREGGKGEKATNEWKMNSDLVVDLATAQKKITGNYQALEVVENLCAEGGENTPPPVKVLAKRVKLASRGGEAHTTQTVTNHQIEPSASADAREKSRTAPLGKPRSAFNITPDRDKSNWKAWVDLLEENGKSGLIAAAERKGKMVVTSKWPNSTEGLRGLLEPKQADHTQRMLGESAA